MIAEPRGLLRREAMPLAVSAGLALLAVLVPWILGRFGGADRLFSCIAAIAGGTLWVTLAPPVLSAGRSGWLAGALLGGIAADAAGVGLLVVWLVEQAGDQSSSIPLLSVLRVYLVWACVTIAGLAAGRCGTTPPGRAGAGIAAVVLLGILLLSPLWVNGRVDAAETSHEAVAWANLAVAVNPFYAAASAAGESGFVWHATGTMYEWSRLGEYVQPAVIPWYRTALGYLAAASVLAGVAGLITRRGRTRRVPAHS